MSSICARSSSACSVLGLAARTGAAAAIQVAPTAASNTNVLRIGIAHPPLFCAYYHLHAHSSQSREIEAMFRSMRTACAALALTASILVSGAAFAQAPKPGVKGYEVEWVYRVRYGFIDEWWDIFRKYQLAILDREKALGYVLDYRVYHPQLHTDEAA